MSRVRYSLATHLGLVCECLQDWFCVAQYWDAMEITAFKLREEMRETDGPRVEKTLDSPFACRNELPRDKVCEGSLDD